MLAPAAERVGVALRSDAVQLGEETIITDPVRLEQILWNLVSNAIQASSPGQAVEIGASVDDGRQRITVTDQGRGIEPEELRTIFEPFRQGRASNTHRGLGLGLAITRSIVVLLGGEITASSDGAGRGARFLVELPLATSDADAADEERLSPPDRTMLQSMRVLYVEDDPEVAASISAALRQHVRDVTACSSIDEALAAADEETFDVVITDLALAEGESGTDLLQRLRSRERMRRPAGDRALRLWQPHRARGNAPGCVCRTLGQAGRHDSLIAGTVIRRDAQGTLSRPKPDIQTIH